MRNPVLEELILYSKCLQLIDLSQISLRVRRLSIKCNSPDPMLAEISHFERFLTAQGDAVEELTLDLFFGASALEIALSMFPRLTKFVINVLSCQTVDHQSIADLDLPSNRSVTELRVRPMNTALSDRLLKRLVPACPMITSLYVHAMDQSLLEFVAERMPNLKVLFTITLHIKALPSDKSRFARLQQLSFYECYIDNKPEIQALTLFERRNLVLSFLSGKFYDTDHGKPLK